MPKVLARGVNAVAKSASSHRRYKKGKLRFSKTAPKAKAAQALSGGFNPINKASDIVPFAVQKTGQQIMLSSPAFTGYRFILDKLYKL